MFVLVSQNSHGSLTEYFLGRTYIYQGQYFASCADRDQAKVYKSKKRADLAAESLMNKVGDTFIVEELE